jgi:ACR3 family arsenite transporter
MDTELAHITPANESSRSFASAGSAIAPAEGGLTVSCTPMEGEEERLGSILANNEEGLRCRFYRNNVEGGQVDVFDVVGYRVSDGDSPRLHYRCNPENFGQEDRVSLVLSTGDEFICNTEVTVDKHKKEKEDKSIFWRLSFLDRFLYVWILVDMLLAVVIGYYVKQIKKAFEVAEITSVSLPICIGLWVMMYPVLCKVRYELVGTMVKSRELGRNVLLSVFMNWIIGPALMTGLAWATLPDLPGYRAGIILIGIARCIAMVLIWNDLAKGDSQLCAVLVAVNSILQIIFFTPVSLFYLKVVSRGQGIHVNTWDVAKSVLLFLGVPLAAGIITRFSLRRTFGNHWYQRKFIPFIGPWALIGLLYTIFVMFSIQAHHIISDIGHVVRVAVPLILYFGIVFFSSIAACRFLKIPYSQSVTQSFTASSNNFELAIAVAVGSFGIDSEQALAATIGPLIEVPILLLLVHVILALRTRWFR